MSDEERAASRSDSQQTAPGSSSQNSPAISPVNSPESSPQPSPKDFRAGRDDHSSTAAMDKMPAPTISRMRWPFPWIWLIPIAAIAVAGYYFYDQHRQRGPEITIEFANADGLRPGETPVDVLGVQVGLVTGTTLSQDKHHVLVHVQLDAPDAGIAVEGSQFWVVRADLGSGNLSALSTVISGPYVEATAGAGKPMTMFHGRSSPPVTIGDGIRVILHADRLQHLSQDAPVYFRGIQVGVVQDIRLNSAASGVNATLVVWRRFAGLLRLTSEFWSTPGADVKGGIFSGLQLKLGDLKSIISGGVSFATPDEGPMMPVGDGADFTLHDEPKDAWLRWSPHLQLGPEKPNDDDQPNLKNNGASPIASPQ